MISQVKLINENKFGEAALDKNVQTFVVYNNSMAAKIVIHLAEKPQIIYCC